MGLSQMSLQLVRAQTGMSAGIREWSGNAVLSLGTGVSWGVLGLDISPHLQQ